jgi:hypothetical protein
MASTCVQQSSNTWLYEQALQLLLMMYREPTQVRAAGTASAASSAGLGLRLTINSREWECCVAAYVLGADEYCEPTQVSAAGTASAASTSSSTLCMYFEIMYVLYC